MRDVRKPDDVEVFDGSSADTKLTTSKEPHFNPGRFDDLITTGYFGPWRKDLRHLPRDRTNLVQWLRKKGKVDQALVELADKLEACNRDRRCKSGACPECANAARELVVEAGTRLLEMKIAEGDTIVRVSIAPADGGCAPGGLKADQHLRNERRWKDALGRAGVTWFLGASDWSSNEHVDDRYAPHWAHHFYGFTAAKDLKRLKALLRKQFPATATIPRPVTVEGWDGKEDAVCYMVKSEFWRRIGTDKGKRFDKANGKARACRATDKQRLTSAQNCELLLHLDAIGLQGRLLLRWLRFMRLGDDPVVVERPPRRPSSS
jgi:hypothetical protein